jgi:hypothetical protein
VHTFGLNTLAPQNTRSSRHTMKWRIRDDTLFPFERTRLERQRKAAQVPPFDSSRP